MQHWASPGQVSTSFLEPKFHILKGFVGEFCVLKLIGEVNSSITGFMGSENWGFAVF